MDAVISQKCLETSLLIFLSILFYTYVIWDSSYHPFILFSREFQDSTLRSEVIKKSKQSIISPLYSDLGLHVYGEWAEGFLHNRTTFTKDHLLLCNRSKNEKPLHFVFYIDKLNKIDAVEKMRDILANKKLFFVGDSTTRELYLGISVLLGIQAKIAFFPVDPDQVGFMFYE